MEILAVAALSLVLAAAVEVPVALFITRPKVRADTAELVEAARTKLQTELAANIKAELVELRGVLPGSMRGGSDPIAMNEAKADKAEMKAVAAAENEANVLAQLSDKVGPDGAAMFWEWLGTYAPDIKATAIKFRSGYRALAPFLTRFKQVQANGVDAAKAERAPYQTE